MVEPRTPSELKAAFKALLDSEARHPLMLAAIDELVDKLEDVYCGEAELSAVEFLFGKILVKALLENLY